MNQRPRTQGRVFPSSAMRDIAPACQAYFAQFSQHSYANLSWWVKVGSLALLAMLCFLFLLLNPLESKTAHLVGMIVFNLLLMALGLNIAHDASHRALFRSAKWNRRFTKVFDLVGISGYVWTMRHVNSHHKYTNVPEMDADLGKQSLIRLSPATPVLPLHKYQVFYAPLVYTHYTLLLVYLKDFLFLAKKEGAESRAHPVREIAIAIAGKVIYTGYALVLPMVLTSHDVGWIVLSFYISHLVTSFTALLVLFPTHFQDQTYFPAMTVDNRVDMGWFEHQLACTADFAPHSRLLTWMTGGLNLHMVHHMFPTVCHIHYPELTRIVREYAEQKGMTYHSNSWPAAIASHWRFLYRMGRSRNPYADQGAEPERPAFPWISNSA